MKYIPTIFLRLAIIGYGALILLFCIFLLPNWIMSNMGHPDESLIILATIGVYGAAIPFYIALYQGMKLLSYIDSNKAFTKKSVKALGVIKYAAFTTSLVALIGTFPLMYTIAQFADAPGFMLFGLALGGAPVVVGIFAAVMQRLLQKIVEIKSENDLTV